MYVMLAMKIHTSLQRSTMGLDPGFGGTSGGPVIPRGLVGGGRGAGRPTEGRGFGFMGGSGGGVSPFGGGRGGGPPVKKGRERGQRSVRGQSPDKGSKFNTLPM